MFGTHDIPFEIRTEGLVLSFQRRHGTSHYLRESGGEKAEKVLLTDKCRADIHPIEPLNTPREITSKILIEFEAPMLIEPRVSRRTFVKFPVEIGVFIVGSDGKSPAELLDCFALLPQKFTLYGNTAEGVICKYWRSAATPVVPPANPYREGIMELAISNKTGRWGEVTKAVFDAYQMKIYHNTKLVAMKARMDLIGDGAAETEIEDSPLEKGMRKASELFVARKFPVLSGSFVMEWGI